MNGIFVGVALALSLLTALALLLLWRQNRRLARDFTAQQRLLADLQSRVDALQGPSVPPPPISNPVQDLQTGAQPFEAPAPSVAATDWEAQIGANWLNRVGALVLVIGFALLLAFSWTKLGALGKVAIGGGSGLVLLLGGVALSRIALYRSYAVSLIAGGWALLYFTSYATYAVDAARLFSGPALPFLAMMAVSAGMVVHALRYESEAATAMAVVFAFVTLHVPEPDVFTTAAAAVLAIGALALSFRFGWSRLPVAAAVLTYLTVAVRYAGMPSHPAYATAALWVYWLCFEAFDLLRPALRRAASPLFAINLTGFVGASLLLNPSRTTSETAAFFAAAAVAYLVSAFLRARAPSSREDVSPTPSEIAIIAAAGLAATALIQHFGGASIGLSVGLEGELVVLAAWSLRRLWLRRAGEALLALAVCRLLLFDAFETDPWTLVAFALALALVANRRLLPNSWPHAVGAALLLAAITHAELPNREMVAAAWAIAAVVCVSAGQRFNLPDVRWLGVPIALAACLRALLVIAAAGSIWPAILTAACLYAIQFLWDPRRGSAIPALASVLATILIAAALAQEIEGGMLTVAFGVQAGALLGAGFATANRTLRLSGLCIFLLCVGKLFVYDLRELDAIGRTLAFLGLGVLLLASSWIYTRRKAT